MELISNEEKQTRALLVCVDTGGYDAEASMSELRAPKARERHLCGQRQIGGDDRAVP